MNSYDILLIIVSTAFAISLVVWIVVGVLIIQVVKKLKEATDVAQNAVENVEQFTTQLKNAGRATAVGSLIKQVTSIFKDSKK